MPSSTSISTPREQLSLRLNTTRYWGSNHVFLDPASPVTYDSISNNGEQLVFSETARLTRTVRFGERYKLNLRAEFFNLFNRDN